MKLIRIVAGLVLTCALLSVLAATPSKKYSTIVGYWQSIDDKTHLPSGVMYIWEKNHKYFAKVAKVYPIGDNHVNDVCKKCSGADHNKPIAGLTVMRNMLRKSQNFYSGGKIMDPKTAKVYRCRMTLLNSGLRLEVRGYIGISLFGRSQVWLRLSSLNAKHPISPLEN